MFVVIAVNFGVALEADWNSVVDIIATALLLGDDVVGFDLDSAEAMADAAPSVAPR